jgi:hypothetical protein
MIGGWARVVVVLVAVSACDPGIRLEGRVLDASGKPVAGADARIVCEGAVWDHASTDEAGKFRYWRIGYLGPECMVDAVAGDRRATPIPVMEHCARRFRDGCTQVTIDLVLR